MGKAMKAMVAAAGLPAFDDAEAWGRIGAWWRDQGEVEDGLEERIAELEAEAEDHEERTAAVLAEVQHAREMGVRELEAARADNAALRKVIDKFTMTVPAVVVGQSLRLIESHCVQQVPEDARGHISTGRISPDEQRWHPILRAILNEARRALAAMEAGK